MIEKVLTDGYAYLPNCLGSGVCGTLLLKFGLAMFQFEHATYRKNDTLNEIYRGPFGSYSFLNLETNRLFCISVFINNALGLPDDAAYWHWEQNRMRAYHISQNGRLLAAKNDCEEHKYYAFLGVSRIGRDHSAGEFYINDHFSRGKTLQQDKAHRKYFDLDQGDVLVIDGDRYIAGTKQVEHGTHGIARELCVLRAVEKA